MCYLDARFLNVLVNIFFTGHVGKRILSDGNGKIIAFRIAWTGTVLQALAAALQCLCPVSTKEANRDFLAQRPDDESHNHPCIPHKWKVLLFAKPSALAGRSPS